MVMWESHWAVLRLYMKKDCTKIIANIKWSHTSNETLLWYETQQQEWKIFYSREQIQTVIKPDFYRRLCQLVVVFNEKM